MLLIDMPWNFKNMNDIKKAIGTARAVIIAPLKLRIANRISAIKIKVWMALVPRILKSSLIYIELSLVFSIFHASASSAEHNIDIF
jgi:hypothetical protein